MTWETYTLMLGAYGYIQYSMKFRCLLSQVRHTFASAIETGAIRVKKKKRTTRASD